jgi:hypothetical protein
LGKAPNLEANLAYAVCLKRNAKAFRALCQAWLDSEDAQQMPDFFASS